MPTPVDVNDTFGRVISGAVVVLKDAAGSTATNTTDMHGNTTLVVPQGEYTVYATKAGYRSTIKTVTLEPTPPNPE